MKGKRYYLYGMVLLTAVISAVALSGCGSSGTEEGTVTVTFCAAGEEDIVLTTEYGGSITPPKVPAKIGNEGRWDTEAFNEIRQDMKMSYHKLIKKQQTFFKWLQWRNKVYLYNWDRTEADRRIEEFINNI